MTDKLEKKIDSQRFTIKELRSDLTLAWFGCFMGWIGCLTGFLIRPAAKEDVIYTVIGVVIMAACAGKAFAELFFSIRDRIKLL